MSYELLVSVSALLTRWERDSSLSSAFLFLKSVDQVSGCPQEGIGIRILHCLNVFLLIDLCLQCILGLEMTFLMEVLGSGLI